MLLLASTLAILAALDSNLVANLGLRKYSPLFYLHQFNLQQQARLMGFLRLAFEDVQQYLVDLILILRQQKM